LIANWSEDTQNIIKATRITPKKICFYTAAPWKWKVYLSILEKSKHAEVKLNELMKEFSTEEDLKERLKEISKFVSKIVMDTNKVSEKRRENLLKIEAFNEKDVIEEARSFLMDRFKAQIVVYSEEDKKRYDPKQRALVTMPCRPAIYIE